MLVIPTRSILCAALLLVACNHDVVVGGVGQSCASTPCTVGLVCVAEVCAYPSSSDAGLHDAATTGDAATGVDAASGGDAASSCGACDTRRPRAATATSRRRTIRPAHATAVCASTRCTTRRARTDSSTAQIYSSIGSCAAGACSYGFGYQSCAAGCASGACKNAGWTTATSNTTTELNAVWGSSASAVWAGGYGAMVYYDGAAWEVRNAGVTSGEVIYSIHGTSASNVFASVNGEGATRIIRYDGTSWTSIATLPTAPYQAAVFAIGSNDVLVYALGSSTGTLYRVTNGTVTKLVATSWGDIYFQPAPRLWAFSATDIYLGGRPPQHFDGTSLTTVGASMDSIYNYWAASSTAIFGNGAISVDELSSGSWSSLGFNTANATEINAISGTSPTRLFAAGGDSEDTTDGFIEYYDGTGWTSAVLPAGTTALNDIYAAPSGQVFAVGWKGTIVQGP